MGVKERRARQKVEMKDLILQSAHQLFLEKGYSEVSIRNIAEAIEYSPATIYLYFKDKDDIFYALHQEAFRFFKDYIALKYPREDPMERLFAIGERYMQFASAHPNYYEIMFITESPMRCDGNADEWKEGEGVLNFMEGVVEDCIATGYFKQQNVKILLFTIWSFMHGMCALKINDRLRIYKENEREAILMHSFEFFKVLLQTL